MSKEYNLSSNDFSKALDAIQSRRELSAICGHVIPIPGLDAAALGQFFDIWLKVHGLSKIVEPPADFDAGLDFSKQDFCEKLLDHEKSAKLTIKIIKSVKLHAFAALFALFYFDGEENFSDIFEKLLAQYRKKAEMYVDAPAEYLDDARHLLEKTAALKSILNSLNFLGQQKVVTAVIDRYQLHDHVSKLLRPSNRARAHTTQRHSYV